MRPLLLFIICSCYVSSVVAQPYRPDRYQSLIDGGFSSEMMPGITPVKAQQWLHNLDSSIGSGSLNAEDFYNRGLIKRYLGNNNGALIDYNAAVALDSGSWYIFTNRSIIYQEKKKYAEAMADDIRAIRLAPGSALVYSNRGYLYHVQRKYTEALADYDKAIKLDTLMRSAYVNKMHLLLEQDKLKDAEKIINRMFQVFPTEPRVYVCRSFYYEKTHDYEAALQDLDKAVTMSNGNPDILIARARFKDDIINDDEGAVDDCTAAIAKTPENPTFYYERCRPLFDLKKFDRIVTDCNTALALDSNFYYAYVMRGDALDLLQKPEQALKDYEKAISLDPTNPEVYFQMSSVYSSRGDFKNTAAVLDRFVAIDATEPKIMKQRGWARMLTGDFASAKNDFSALAALTPKEPVGYYLRATAEDSLGEKDKACKDMVIADKMDMGEAHTYLRKKCPRYMDAKIRQGEDLLEQANNMDNSGDHDGAIKLYDKLIALMPDSSAGYYNRGKAKRRKEDHEGAIADYKRSLKNGRNLGDIWVSIAISQDKLGRRTEAIVSLKKAIELDSTHEMAYYDLACFLADMKNYKEAIPNFKQAIRCKPDYTNAFMGMGLCYVELGNKDEACKAFKRAEALGDGRAIAERIDHCQ